MDSLRRVTLPSAGVFTNGVKEIVIKAIGFEQEKKIFSSSTEEAIDEVLKECIVEPKDFDVMALTLPDREYLLYQLRIHSYGDDYHVQVMEKGQYVEKTVSLEDMEVITLDPDEFKGVGGKMPMTGDSFTVKLPSTEEVRSTKRFAQEKAQRMGLDFKDVYYELTKASIIDTINGEQLTGDRKIAWLKSLPGRDLAYFDHVSSKIKFGYTGLVPVEVNGIEVKAKVTMTGEFFRPRFDD